MRIYKNDLTGNVITGKEYDKMHYLERSEYSYYKSVSKKELKKRGSSGDPLLSGIIGYATNSGIVGGLLGGSLLGGILGDALNDDDDNILF